MPDAETPDPPKPLTVPRLSDDEIRQFVIDVLGDRIFTSNHVPTDDKRALGRRPFRSEASGLGRGRRRGHHGRRIEPSGREVHC